MGIIEEDEQEVKVSFVKLYNITTLRKVFKRIPGAAWLTVFLYLMEHLKYGKSTVYGSLRDIAKECGCGRSTVLRILNELHHQGIITRDPDCDGKVRVSPHYGYVGDNDARNKTLGGKEGKSKSRE